MCNAVTHECTCIEARHTKASNSFASHRTVSITRTNGNPDRKLALGGSCLTALVYNSSLQIAIHITRVCVVVVQNPIVHITAPCQRVWVNATRMDNSSQRTQSNCVYTLYIPVVHTNYYWIFGRIIYTRFGVLAIISKKLEGALWNAEFGMVGIKVFQLFLTAK